MASRRETIELVLAALASGKTHEQVRTDLLSRSGGKTTWSRLGHGDFTVSPERDTEDRLILVFGGIAYARPLGDCKHNIPLPRDVEEALNPEAPVMA